MQQWADVRDWGVEGRGFNDNEAYFDRLPARAKGVAPGRILRVHILRNALLPVISFAGIQAGQLIGGSILVETVFAWPGIGRLAFEALLQRDYNLLLGVFFCTSVMVILFNLLTDLAYAAIDPRIEVAS